jgi:hypothetical protein
MCADDKYGTSFAGLKQVDFKLMRAWMAQEAFNFRLNARNGSIEIWSGRGNGRPVFHARQGGV